VGPAMVVARSVSRKEERRMKKGKLVKILKVCIGISDGIKYLGSFSFVRKTDKYTGMEGVPV
jgi:hypothetical protein